MYVQRGLPAPAPALLVLLRPAQWLGIASFRLDGAGGGAAPALRMSPLLECWSVVMMAVMVLLSWRCLFLFSHLLGRDAKNTLYFLSHVCVGCIGAVTSHVG